MFKKSTDAFQTRLWESIQTIEQNSQVEVVVILRPRSESYRDVALLWGIASGWLCFTYLIFAPELFGDLTIYLAPQLAFAFGMLLGRLPALTRLGVSKRRKQKSVETMARALFQKGGIGHTQRKIGVLIYGSRLEKTVYLLPDRGVETALPAEEWLALRTSFERIFKGGDAHENLLRELQAAKPVFQRYLPPLPNDINELPDDLDIDL